MLQRFHIQIHSISSKRVAFTSLIILQERNHRIQRKGSKNAIFFREYYIDIFFGALWAVSSFSRVLPRVAFAVSNRAGLGALAALGSQWSQNWIQNLKRNISL